MRVKILLSITLFLSIVGWGPISIFSSPSENFDYPTFSLKPTAHTAAGSQAWLDQEIKAIKSQAKNLDTGVLKLSLTAYQKAKKQGVNQDQVLTIIDYSKPSSERRLWVVDVKKKKVLFNTWVAHGKNSGRGESTSFSNADNSLKSSYGVFVTSETYSGKHGYSLRIQGLESGVNDNAYRRNIVFHGAGYVSHQASQGTHSIGRSWGCMAVSPEIIKPLINTIKNKSLIFAYYPDKKWLKKSNFLT